MTSVSYNDLITLINNSGLVVGEEYEVNTYPNIHPVLKARTTNELWRDGYTADGYKLLYNPVNNGEYGWTSNYGYVYYLQDANGNSAWCDWINDNTNLFGGTNSNVHITPYIVSGVYTLPTLRVRNSSNSVIGGSSSLVIVGFTNGEIGDGCSGTVGSVSDTTIGDNNTDLYITNSINVVIGSSNSFLTVNGKGIDIGNGNRSVSVIRDNASIGSGNININVNADNNTIGSNCVDVTITADLNYVENSKYVSIDSPYNIVEKSEAVTLTESVGNKVDDSKLVYLDSVNNNDLWVNEYIKSQNAYTMPDGVTVVQYDTGDPVPFQSVKNDDSHKVKKVVVNNIPRQKDESDNFGLVVNTVDNVYKNASKSDKSYFINTEGHWVAEGVNTDEYDAVTVISKRDSLFAYVTGGGRYKSGDVATFDYSWVDQDYTASFLDGNNVEHAAPYSVIMDKNVTVFCKVVHT